MLRGSKNNIRTSLKAFLYSLYFTHNFAIKDFKVLLFFFLANTSHCIRHQIYKPETGLGFRLKIRYFRDL